MNTFKQVDIQNSSGSTIAKFYDSGNELKSNANSFSDSSGNKIIEFNNTGTRVYNNLFYMYGNGTNASESFVKFYMLRSNGTYAAPTATDANDTLGRIWVSGYNSGYQNAVRITITQDGAITGSGVPGKLTISTGAGNGTINTVLTLDKDKKASFTGDVAITGKLGINGSTPPTKPTVTGSRGSNAALASLLTALASYGLITDSTND